jgi:hypothetical protein
MSIEQSRDGRSRTEAEPDGGASRGQETASATLARRALGAALLFPRGGRALPHPRGNVLLPCADSLLKGDDRHCRFRAGRGRDSRSRVVRNRRGDDNISLFLVVASIQITPTNDSKC